MAETAKGRNKQVSDGIFFFRLAVGLVVALAAIALGAIFFLGQSGRQTIVDQPTQSLSP